MNGLLNLGGIQEAPWKIFTGAMGRPTNEGFRPSSWGEMLQLFYIKDSKRNYFFDAVLKTDHVNQRRLTTHPVQSGANITDHSYKIPSKLTMEIGISDAMSILGFDGNEPWTGYGVTKERSVIAFNQLLTMSDSGQPFTVMTRLKKYTNMVIESIEAIEDYRTLHELRASIVFTEVILASGVNIKKESADIMVTNNIDTGPVQGQKMTPRNNNSFFLQALEAVTGSKF
jgi:hypothetical protein